MNNSVHLELTIILLRYLKDPQEPHELSSTKANAISSLWHRKRLGTNSWKAALQRRMQGLWWTSDQEPAVHPCVKDGQQPPGLHQHVCPGKQVLLIWLLCNCI